MHKDKQNISKFFVVPGSSPALLGMLDLETLGVLTIKCETIGRQLTQDDNPYKRQRNCKSERAVQAEGRMLMYKKNAMQTIHPSQVLLLIQWSQAK